MARRSRSRSRSRDRHRSSRRRSRSRSRDRRSRSHRRSRSRSRDRSSRRDDRRHDSSSQAHADMVQRMQHETIQKQLLAQQMLLQQQQGGPGGGQPPSKKQREVYVGNLAIGPVSDMVLRELFNKALNHLVPDPVGNPPVINAQIDPSGRFGFVELRSEELASSAMHLDKVELCGRQINVGRPKGYVEPPGGPVPAVSFNAAQMFAASLARRASSVLLFENMLKAHQLHDDRERDELVLDVKDECEKYGSVQGIAVPKPPLTVRLQPGRVYVRFATAEEAEKALPAFNGREFDGAVITAKTAPEEEFDRAFAGQWTGGLDPAPVPVMPHVYTIPNPQSGPQPV